MKVVVFGLTVSSSWGNGHATLWRGLCRALHRRGHQVVFFERDVPYYATHRDMTELPGGGRLHLYPRWSEVLPLAKRELQDADVAMVTSYCPDGIGATELVLDTPVQVRAFYDMDTPITLKNLCAGETTCYIGPKGLIDFDLVLSYTGGAALEALQTRLGARRVAPLYGHVDPEVHHSVQAVERYRADLSYRGTYAADRQDALESFLIGPARMLPHRKFLIGGAQYPHDFPWADNIYFVRHLPPAEHAAFFCSSRLTLNVTRRAMADMGYCPSGRLFEAAACATPVLTDQWEGLDTFYQPGSEVLIARSGQDVIDALELSDAELNRIAQAARQRTLDEHTSDHRARELEDAIELHPVDAIFRARPLIAPEESLLVGLPDTIWFPADALTRLPDDSLQFPLFPVQRPEFFDAVVFDEGGRVREIQVKRRDAESNWIWGAFKMPGKVLHELYDLWCEPGRRDEYIGTLVNAYLARGGRAEAVRAGESYVDVGTLNGYRQAIQLLATRPRSLSRASAVTACGPRDWPLERQAEMIHHGDTENTEAVPPWFQTSSKL